MPTEVNKCIFRGSNSAILNFAALVNGVQLIKSAHSSFHTTLEGFCQPGKKGGSKLKVVPLCENGREKAAWFTQITTLIKL